MTAVRGGLEEMVFLTLAALWLWIVLGAVFRYLGLPASSSIAAVASWLAASLLVAWAL